MSKDVFDVSFTENGQPKYLGQFPNSVTGFKKMNAQLKKKTKHHSMNWIVCFENTGVYSKQFLSWLFKQAIPCIEESPIQMKRSLGLKRGKSDKLDSLSICRYVFEKRDCIQASQKPNPLIVNIKVLISRRSLLLKHKLALQVSVKEQKIALDPLFWKSLNKTNQVLINEYNQQIKKIDKEIIQLIRSDKSINANYNLILSITGIGPLIGATLIVVTNNFTKFEDARKLACFIGIAPFPNSSGKFTGQNRVSKMANKKIKATISNGVVAAIRYDGQIKSYYRRKLAEGKKKGVIYNAIKNKLIHRVFAVVKRKSPYVKMMNYAS